MNASYLEFGAAVTIAEPHSVVGREGPLVQEVVGREGPLVQEFVAASYISQSDRSYPPQTNTTLPEDDEVVIAAQE